MPTGYTAGVQDGTITSFADFALLCARNFGATIEMRDEPLSTPIPEFKPDGYYERRVAELESKMAEYEAMGTGEWDRAAERHYSEQARDHKLAVLKQSAERDRYESMLRDARRYQPPTAEHEGLKKFMVEQLEESIRFDCQWELHPPVALSGEAFRDEQIGRTRRSLQQARESMAGEVERCAKRNAWIKALRESLR